MGFVFFECKNNGKTRDFFKFEFDETANGLVHVDEFVWLWTVSEKKLTLMWLLSELKKMLFFSFLFLLKRKTQENANS